jgi:hypothetical protein
MIYEIERGGGEQGAISHAAYALNMDETRVLQGLRIEPREV